MGGDPKHQHGEKQTNTFDWAKADTQADVDPKVTPTPLDQVHRITQANRERVDPSPGISGPDNVDLGDHVVGGKAHYQDIQVFNNQDLDAYVQVWVEGSAAIVLDHAPERLRPSREGSDPSAAIKLAFVPTTRGRVHGTIVVKAGWQNAVHAPQEIRISVDAAAHEEGEALVAEQEAEERAQADKQKADAEDKVQMEHAQQAADARLDDPKLANKLPGTAAERKRFDAAQRLAGDALFDLYENRRVGIDTAQAEAAEFQRHVPAHEESLLETLAWAALDVATDGIAGTLGKTLEGALSRTMTVAEHTLPNGMRAAAQEFSPNKAVVAFFTNSVKDVVKRTGKAATGAAKHATAGHDKSAPIRDVETTDSRDLSNPGPSADPLLAFFQTEKISLIHQHREKATEVVQNAGNTLEPMLDHSPKQAIDAMREIAATLTDYAKDEVAANKQAQASATHWIQYIAQTSLGSVSVGTAREQRKHPAADASPTTEISSANVAPTENGAPLAHDGLLDIRFTADRTHPWEPVAITKAHVNGLSKAMADHLRREPLRDAHVPVRAYAEAKRSDAVVGLEVIRDEAGNVDYTDDTGSPGMPGNWFARKIGEPGGGRDAEGRGARKLIEEEIMNKPLPEIETDSDA